MTVHVGTTERLPVSTVEELDRWLDRIEREITEPTLVRLSGEGATLHIGLGNSNHSIALYLDQHGRAWVSRGVESETDRLVFFKGDRRYEFYSTAAIPPEDHRTPPENSSPPAANRPTSNGSRSPPDPLGIPHSWPGQDRTRRPHGQAVV